MSDYKERIDRDFSKAAKQYNDYALIQKDISNDLLDFTREYFVSSKKIIDIGCGTGFLGNNLKNHNLTQIDIAQGMCDIAKENGHKTHCLDMDKLDGLDNKFDVIYASMSLQWSRDIRHTLQILQKIANEKAVFIFSLLLDSSFSKLKKNRILSDSFFSYFTEDKFEMLLADLSFRIIKSDLRYYYSKSENIINHLKQMKNIGANNKNNIHNKLFKIRDFKDPITLNYDIKFLTISSSVLT